MRSLVAWLARPGLGQLISSTFLAAILGRAIMLAMAVLLGRQLGPEGYGLFVFAMGLGMLLGQLSGLGWPVLLTRLVPSYLQDGQLGLIAGLRRKADIVVLVASCVGASLIWGIALLVIKDDTMVAALGLAGLIAPFVALRHIRRSALAASGAPARGLLADEVLSPLAVVILVLLVEVESALPALALYALGSALAVALATWILDRRIPRAGTVPEDAPVSEWWAIALPGYLGMMVRPLMQRMDVLMIAPLSTLVQVGLYGAVLRLTFLLTFPQVVVSTVMMPRIARAHSAGNITRLRRLFAIAMTLALITTLLPGAVLWIFAEQTVSLIFGQAFATPSAISTLRVLVVAQALLGLAMPLAGVLLMCGLQRRFATTSWIALCCTVAVNLTLIPSLGAQGAAWGSLAMSICLLTLQSYPVWRIIHPDYARMKEDD